ncbi:unnamed protein product [Brachionus calyciflorus]|uniref:Reverse transcriptase domain-containing protein n=1 Tax=Brachionus calyciflorus TaxID=104777 RepID=A0A814EWL1_9BILA|nr:unnamed protein product [Brachionus calyciflorus]
MESKIDITTINNIFYADDVLLIANSFDEMNQLLEITNKYGQEYEIKFNPNKTHFMIMFSKQFKENRENGKLIMFQNYEVKRVIMMKYLGMWIDETFNSREHLKSRIKLFNMGSQRLKQCGITSDCTSSEVKLCFYKTYIRPALYYGFDNLVINKTQIKTLQTLESKLIKAMFRISKKTRSTKLLRAVNIEKVYELWIKTKVKFLNRLIQFELTRNIVESIIKYDNTSSTDKKSLVMDLIVKTNGKNSMEMINRGNKIMFETNGDALLESKLECVIEIKEVLKTIGDERRIKLNQMLRIEY